jgi:hypothetical protein
MRLPLGDLARIQVIWIIDHWRPVTHGAAFLLE